MLAPVALSDLGGQCIEAARGMRDLTGAEIIVLHSVTYPDDMSIRRTGDYEEAIAAYHKKVRDEAFAKLHEMMGDDSAHFHLELAERAKIAELIPECATKQNADIVLLGSTPQSKLVHFFMRGTEEKVLGELDTSVWVLKPHDA